MAMTAERVTAEEYEKLVPDRRVFFNEPRFTELNREKAEEVHYLILRRDASARFGVILGKTGDMIKCPWSAPYSYPVEIKRNEKVESVDEALAALEDYCRGIGGKTVRFIFPPLFYDEHLLSAWVSAFYRTGYTVANLDLSYALDLDDLSREGYEKDLPEKGRKGLRKAKASGLTIQKCETDEEIAEAYGIIRANHDAKGRPTHMSLEQVMDTLKLVPHDVFIVRHGADAVVSEILYRVNDRIVQGIYTGTLDEFAQYNGMNFLTDYTIRYYHDLGYRILDKATATEDSVPNRGLCNFKESVGCRRSLKYTFIKDL